MKSITRGIKYQITLVTTDATEDGRCISFDIPVPVNFDSYKEAEAAQGRFRAVMYRASDEVSIGLIDRSNQEATYGIIDIIRWDEYWKYTCTITKKEKAGAIVIDPMLDEDILAHVLEGKSPYILVDSIPEGLEKSRFVLLQEVKDGISTGNNHCLFLEKVFFVFYGEETSFPYVAIPSIDEVRMPSNDVVSERNESIKALYVWWCLTWNKKPNMNEGWFRSKRFTKYLSEIGYDSSEGEQKKFNYVLWVEKS